MPDSSRKPSSSKGPLARAASAELMPPPAPRSLSRAVGSTARPATSSSAKATATPTAGTTKTTAAAAAAAAAASTTRTATTTTAATKTKKTPKATPAAPPTHAIDASALAPPGALVQVSTQPGGAAVQVEADVRAEVDRPTSSSTPSRRRPGEEAVGVGASPLSGEMLRELEAVCSQLGERWAQVCRGAESTKFSWSHNGSQRNGWVELKENGRLETTWCSGTWKVHDGDEDLVDLNFGSSRHVCRVREGGFLVEQKFSIRTGKESYKPGQPKSCGFIRALGEGSQRGTPTPRRAPKVPITMPGASAEAPPKKRPRTALEKAAEGTLRAGTGGREASDADRPAFVQKDLKLSAFFTNWQDWTLKRFDVPVV